MLASLIREKPDLLPSLQVRWRCSVLPHFSSAGKRPFLTGKAKNICWRCTFLGRKLGDGHDPNLTGKFLAAYKFSETSISFGFLKPILGESAVISYLPSDLRLKTYKKF